MRRSIGGGIVVLLLVGILAGWKMASRDRTTSAEPVPNAALPGPADTGESLSISDSGEPPAPCPIQLRDVTSETGITFRHTDGSSGEYYIVETVTAGVASFDYDGDGLIDIYFANGAPVNHAPPGPPPRDALYRNLGGFRFQEVTEQAGLGNTAFAVGVTVADYNTDGNPDVYVSNFGPNVLYQNNGDGTFTDATHPAGVSDGNKLGAGACFLDMEGDGDLDLFAGNYVRFSFETHAKLYRFGYPEYAGPKRYPPERQTLFRNNGDGTFEDVTESSGIAAHPGKGMGVVGNDFDNDGDTDLFLLNDVYGNFFFLNDGAGHFEEVSLRVGLKFNGEGRPLGSMGVDCADYDNDGRLDFYQTSFQQELPALYRNLGDGNLSDRGFGDVTKVARAGQRTAQLVKWGCGFVDFDNDSHRDIFVATGHLQDQIEHYDNTTSFRSRNVVFRNNGQGQFDNVSARVGDGLHAEHSSRGAAFDDLDNDGDIDAVVVNIRDAPTVLRNIQNESSDEGHWLQIQLRGVTTNRDGVGAQVRVVAGDRTLVDEVHSGRGYQGHYGSRLHFGLGAASHVDRIEVRWIGGTTDVLADAGVDRLVTIIEGGRLHGRAGGPQTGP